LNRRLTPRSRESNFGSTTNAGEFMLGVDLALCHEGKVHWDSEKKLCRRREEYFDLAKTQ